MQNEHTVIRLEWQAIRTNYSYILDELAPDGLVPYLEERRLLSREKAQDVTGKSSRLQKVSTILQALKETTIVGTLPTFCAALISAGQPHIARRLNHSENKVHCTSLFVLFTRYRSLCRSCNTSTYGYQEVSRLYM